jgi:hypothetical protein
MRSIHSQFSTSKLVLADLIEIVYEINSFVTKRVNALWILFAKGVFIMRKKPPEIDFGKEAEEHLKAIRSRIGQEVPLSNHYVRGRRPILVSIEGDTATLQFHNGALLVQVPLRYLVDDSGYRKT